MRQTKFLLPMSCDKIQPNLTQGFQNPLKRLWWKSTRLSKNLMHEHNDKDTIFDWSVVKPFAHSYLIDLQAHA